MKFRTELNIPKSDFKINLDDKIAIFGSCFAENISEKLSQAGFCIDANPFGIVYNPISLADIFHQIVDNKIYTENDLIKHDGVYHSFSHHSRFSSSDKNLVLEKINSRIKEAFIFLKTADYLIITFGTSYYYRLAETGQPVSNCHKLPEKYFYRKRMSIEDIVSQWVWVIPALTDNNPNLRIIFTVSPIRHFRDGFHENQLSKSILLLAIEELIDIYPSCSYFPSYELLLDDLRDYRFYARDLVHPSDEAIDYIWEKFSDAYFDLSTKKMVDKYEKKSKSDLHRPIIR